MTIVIFGWTNYKVYKRMLSWLLNYKFLKMCCCSECIVNVYVYLAWRTGTCERVESRGERRLTSCIWALNRAHEDNWKDCIITWATPCGAKHSQLHHVRNRGHTPALKRITRKPDTHLTTSSALLMAVICLLPGSQDKTHVQRVQFFLMMHGERV